MGEGMIKRARNWLPFGPAVTRHLAAHPDMDAVSAVCNLKMAVDGIDEVPKYSQLVRATGALMRVYAEMAREFDGTTGGWRVTVSRVPPKDVAK